MPSGRDRVFARSEREAVYEIEITTVNNAREQIVRLNLVYAAPAHVRHRRLQTCLKLIDDTRYDSKTLSTVFRGRLRQQQLHAEADAEYRLCEPCDDL